MRSILLFLIAFSISLGLNAQCRCLDSENRIEFTTPAELKLFACVSKGTTLGSQSVNWCLTNNTNDHLEIRFNKNYFFTCGNNKTKPAYLKLKPHQTEGKWDLSLSDSFFKEDCANDQKLSRISVSDIVFSPIGKNSPSPGGSGGGTVAGGAGSGWQGGQNGNSGGQGGNGYTQQPNPAEQEAARREQQLKEIQRELDELQTQYDQQVSRQQQAISQMDNAFRQLSDYLAMRTRRETIQNLQEQSRSAFQSLKGLASQGYPIESCHLCHEEGTISCHSCNGSGMKSCYLCNGAGKSNCWSCAGTGMFANIRCSTCGGNGSMTCSTCQGRGTNTCLDCLAAGFTNCTKCQGTGKVANLSAANRQPANSYEQPRYMSAPAIPSSDMGPARTGSGGTNLLVDDFSDNRNNWAVGNHQAFEGQVQGNVYRTTQTGQGGRLLWQSNARLNPGDDYEVEVFVRQSPGTNTDLAGLIFGADPQSGNYHTLTINSTQSHWAFYGKKYGFAGQHYGTTSNVNILRPGSINILRVRKSGYRYTLYVNDASVGTLMIESPFGQSFGLFIEARSPAGTTVEFDNFRVTQLPNATNTQDRPISGRIVAEDGSAIAGVNVVVDNSTIGAISDENGYYKIFVPNAAQATLVFSFIGYKTHKRLIEQNERIDVTLISKSRRRR